MTHRPRTIVLGGKGDVFKAGFAQPGADPLCVLFAGTGAVESRLRAGRRGKETGRMVAPRSLSFTEG